jgi:MFS transporter, PAT family, beta-lactamase induction signal transducer AmpG
VLSETVEAVASQERTLMDSIRPYLKKGPLTALGLGISSGFPFTLIAATLTQRLSEGGIERKTISAFALILLVYSIKWAWAPIVDRVKLPILSMMGQRLSWLIVTAAAVAFGVFLLGNADPKQGVQSVLLAALVLALAGATFDVVIDAMRIEHLQPEELGVGSGMSQYGWRLGAFFAGSIALAVAAKSGWSWGYWACAPLVLPAVIVSLWAGEPPERQKRSWPQRMDRDDFWKFLISIPVVLYAANWLDYWLGANILFRISLIGFLYPIVDLSIRRAQDIGWPGYTAWLLALPVVTAAIGNWNLFLGASFVTLTFVAALAIFKGQADSNRFGDAPAALEKRNVVGPMVDFFRRQGAWLVFLFVLVHKIGDTMANLMIRDLLVTVGFSKEQILWGDVVVGFWALLAGIFVGGILYARLGLKRSVLISLILMGVSNFSFAGLAAMGKSVPMLAFTIGFENFASGVGGVAVVALLSAVCNLRFTATQFAMLSAAAAILGRLLTGTLAGGLIDSLGYVDFYLLTTALALPGILLFWWMMHTGLVDKAMGTAAGAQDDEGAREG